MGRMRRRHRVANMNNMIKQTQSDMAKAAKALKDANTVGDAMHRLYETFYNRPDDPSFEQWLKVKLEERRGVNNE